MELGIGAGGGPQAELPSAVIDDGNDVWEDMEEDEDKTCEDDADDDYDMEDIDDAALSKITNFAYKTDNNVSHFSTL
jgi:type IV secretory pathway VirB9-like protein